MAEFPVTKGVKTFLPPPEGYDVDFDNPQSRYKLDHYLIFGIMGPIALFCLIQRLYSKHFLATGLKIDDALMSLAWVTSVLMQSLHVWSISIGGLCHHAFEMPLNVFEKQSLASYIVAPVFITCNGLTKTALLTFYFQISSRKWFRISIYTAIAIVSCYVTVLAALLLFGCQPINAAWDAEMMVTGEGNCVDSAVLYMAIAVANIVSDIILFVIPIPTIIKLKMPVAQKIGAGIMFGIGSLTVATSIIRMVYLPDLLTATDTPWVSARANVWSFVEVNLFIICGSMPTFRKFLRRFAPKLMGTTGSRSGPSMPHSSTNGTLQSKLRRQTRMSYAQFDGLEMEDFDRAEEGKDNVVQGTTVRVSSPLARRDGVMPNTSWDDRSDEGILGGRIIECTKTFDVHYSR